MQTTIQYIKKELEGLYPETEQQGFIRLLLESVCGLNYTQQVLHKNDKISQLNFAKIKEAVDRLKNYEPIQYILGETEFLGLPLKIDHSVLIPRPETEELVNWIIQSNKFDSPDILDIGTGSGCIPLALKKNMPNARISATDISEYAIKVAELNSRELNLEVDFFQNDILNWQMKRWRTYDIIVSNPPYVRESEKIEMSKNVLDFEPDNALFVPENNPLIFYSIISDFSNHNLKKGGYLFFEINEYLGNEMINLLMGKDFENIELRKDIQGKDRMIRCIKK